MIYTRSPRQHSWLSKKLNIGFPNSNLTLCECLCTLAQQREFSACHQKTSKAQFPTFNNIDNSSCMWKVSGYNCEKRSKAGKGLWLKSCHPLKSTVLDGPVTNLWQLYITLEETIYFTYRRILIQSILFPCKESLH